MNIMVSSTYGWNPGDEWILYGCQNIIREATQQGEQLNWLMYNRNPDNMQGRRMYSQLEDSVGNYYTSNIPHKLVDLFVQAGSPEYHGPPAKNFHGAILESDKPYLIMGVGSTNDRVPLTDLDVQVFMRPNTHIFTRSIEAATSINRQLGVEKAQAMPCPAILATFAESVKSRFQVQIPQTDRGFQKVRGDYLDGLDKQVPVIAERTEEWELYTEQGYSVQYSYSASQILSMVGRYQCVMTTRLHAAIVALGMGSEVVLVGKDDHRIETAAKMFDIPVVGSFTEALATPGKLDVDFKIKWQVLNQYKEIVTEALA